MELIRLLLRNTLRHKLRSLLTIVGIAVAVMAFVLLRTVVTAWHAGGRGVHGKSAGHQTRPLRWFFLCRCLTATGSLWCGE